MPTYNPFSGAGGNLTPEEAIKQIMELFSGMEGYTTKKPTFKTDISFRWLEDLEKIVDYLNIFDKDVFSQAKEEVKKLSKDKENIERLIDSGKITEAVKLLSSFYSDVNRVFESVGNELRSAKSLLETLSEEGESHPFKVLLNLLYDISQTTGEYGDWINKLREKYAELQSDPRMQPYLTLLPSGVRETLGKETTPTGAEVEKLIGSIRESGVTQSNSYIDLRIQEINRFLGSIEQSTKDLRSERTESLVKLSLSLRREIESTPFFRRTMSGIQELGGHELIGAQRYVSSLFVDLALTLSRFGALAAVSLAGLELLIQAGKEYQRIVGMSRDYLKEFNNAIANVTEGMAKYWSYVTDITSNKLNAYLGMTEQEFKQLTSSVTEGRVGMEMYYSDAIKTFASVSKIGEKFDLSSAAVSNYTTAQAIAIGDMQTFTQQITGLSSLFFELSYRYGVSTNVLMGQYESLSRLLGEEGRNLESVIGAYHMVSEAAVAVGYNTQSLMRDVEGLTERLRWFGFGFSENLESLKGFSDALRIGRLRVEDLASAIDRMTGRDVQAQFMLFSNLFGQVSPVMARIMELAGPVAAPDVLSYIMRTPVSYMQENLRTGPPQLQVLAQTALAAVGPSEPRREAFLREMRQFMMETLPAGFMGTFGIGGLPMLQQSGLMSYFTTDIYTGALSGTFANALGTVFQQPATSTAMSEIGRNVIKSLPVVEGSLDNVTLERILSGVKAGFKDALLSVIGPTLKGDAIKVISSDVIYKIEENE